MFSRGEGLLSLGSSIGSSLDAESLTPFVLEQTLKTAGPHAFVESYRSKSMEQNSR